MPLLQQLSRKMRWQKQFDIVLGGDSRVQRGMSPSSIMEAIPKARVANFGFSAACFDEQYLSHLESLLAADSKSPTIVIGLTALSLTSYAQKNNEYREYAKKHSAEHFLNDHFGKFIFMFRPYQKRDLKKLFGWSKEQHRYYEIARADGWIETNREPLLPTHALAEYKRLFSQYSFLKAQEDELLRKVGNLVKKGIAVYAFRPPTTKEMALLERKMCDFDESKFIDEFRKRGGKWLHLPQENYQSYDGSHIESPSAKRLSKWIGEELAKQGN